MQVITHLCSIAGNVATASQPAAQSTMTTRTGTMGRYVIVDWSARTTFRCHYVACVHLCPFVHH